MKEIIKNKIIAISGEPVSGKGTVVKGLVTQLIKDGYEEENIHVISTGKEFRNYFKEIINFIIKANNSENLEEFKKNEKIKQILENREYRKALIETIDKAKKEKIDLIKLDIADINESQLFSEMRKVVDYLIDNDMKKTGENINKEKRENDIWIIDSRMAFYNVPDAFSVRLTANPKIAAQRLYNDNTRGEEDRYNSIEEAEKEREDRRISEIKRYKRRYNVDLEDEDNYDLIIDTSYSSIEDITNTILECEKCYEEGKNFGKTWTSPLTMIPCQKFMETVSIGLGSKYSLDGLRDEILKKGFLPDKEIEIFKIDGINYILEGHHRNFASILAGKTLIPYIDLMKTKEGKEIYRKGRYPTTTKSKLYDHEDFVERNLREQKNDEKLKFSYSQIYPNILEEIKKDINFSRFD